MKSSFTFGVTVYPYSVFMVIGACVCLGVFAFLTVKRHRGCSDENAFAVEMLLIAMAAALPDAIFFDALFKIADTGRFEIKGATFYGGLIGALALYPLLLLLKRNRKVSVYDRLCDLAAGIPAGHCFGRIGCFFGGCCFGCPTNGAFGVVFPEGSIPYEFYGGAVKVHPTQLYEAALLLVLFAVLALFGKNRAFPAYLILYGAARFALEFLRADDRGAIFGIPLSPAQILSVVFILLGAGIGAARLFFGRLKKKNEGPIQSKQSKR
ncbi:MAG: prolipoprotein diacylglyceryl transferase [Clostridia bacterium]|nr:prolipoprotein diacylglyceryl transferase [Clostridia bacterium]